MSACLCHYDWPAGLAVFNLIYQLWLSPYIMSFPTSNGFPISFPFNGLAIIISSMDSLFHSEWKVAILSYSFSILLSGIILKRRTLFYQLFGYLNTFLQGRAGQMLGSFPLYTR